MPRFQVDIAPADQEQVPSLVVHHLALAMGYFQAMPEGNEREVLQAYIDQQFQGFNLEAETANRFADELCARYNALKEQD